MDDETLGKAAFNLHVFRVTVNEGAEAAKKLPDWDQQSKAAKQIWINRGRKAAGN